MPNIRELRDQCEMLTPQEVRLLFPTALDEWDFNIPGPREYGVLDNILYCFITDKWIQACWYNEQGKHHKWWFVKRD